MGRWSYKDVTQITLLGKRERKIRGGDLEKNGHIVNEAA